MAARSAASPSFAVLTMFTSSPEHRDRFVTLIHDFVAAQAITRPGLFSFDIFTDEGDEHIVTLAQWRDRAAFEDFKRTDSGRHASELALVLRPIVLFLHPKATLGETPMPLDRAG